jgi:transposase, IS30 family
MRDRRRTPAGGVQAEKQQRYVQLIVQGVNNSEACRLVGINRKTGSRWRYGRRVRNSAGALVIYPPVKIEESGPRSPRYLSAQGRVRIADLLAAKTTVRGIAEQLGRAPSTISRQIRRNSDPDGRYRPHHACSRHVGLTAALIDHPWSEEGASAAAASARPRAPWPSHQRRYVTVLRSRPR